MATKKKASKGRCTKWSKGRKRCLRRAKSRSRRLGSSHGMRFVGAGLGADFSRKHYTAVARMLCAGKASAKVVDSFASYFAADNPSFKSALFRKATKSC